MQPIRILSAAEQVAARLRSEIEQGRWIGEMPGENAVAAELGVNHKTVEAALRQLEQEGHLASQGRGRKRLVVPPARLAARPMRVATLLAEESDRHAEWLVELHHALAAAGHSAILAADNLQDLKMDVARISRLVRKTEADVWVVCGGSREVLEWFIKQPFLSFALFGRQVGLPIQGLGLDNPPAFAAATRKLIELGHRRIVMLVRRLGGQIEPGRCERAFLDEMTAHGIPIGAYNLPEWHESKTGLHELLDSLLRVTPPTAVIIDSPALYFATHHFLTARKIRVPGEVSLICSDPDPAFEWCEPSIAHIRWNPEVLVRRIVRWASTMKRGLREVCQTKIPAEFIAGGTIGPAPTASRPRVA